jgi:hypothetical protein
LGNARLIAGIFIGVITRAPSVKSTPPLIATSRRSDTQGAHLMAARINRKHSEDIRKKIQASVILHRLQKHFNGELDLSRTQLKAAEIMLDRAVPKLAQIQHTGADGEPFTVNVIRFTDAHSNSA